MNTSDKFVPAPFTMPGPQKVWNELLYPREYPALAPRAQLPAPPTSCSPGAASSPRTFTRVYNPVWTNPDGMMWEKVLKDEALIELHAALTPTWSETAQYADYVLAHGGRRRAP